MSDKTYLILHRKSANRESVKKAVKAVQKEADFRVLVPWNKKEKERIVSEVLDRGAERIIAGGGDGTINGVANALIGDESQKPDVTLGIMPLGTANDFAYGCGLPKDHLTECLRIAVTREGRPIDIGKVNKRYFINVASAGFGAEITATTPIKLKKALGGSAYTLMGLVRAFEFSPYGVEIDIPGQESISADMLTMAVGNNHYAGGGFDVAPMAQLDDGLLDLMMITDTKDLLDTNLVKEYENPMREKNNVVRYFQAPEFTIRTAKKMHFNLDGEPYLKNKFKFSLLPKHLKVAF